MTFAAKAALSVMATVWAWFAIHLPDPTPASTAVKTTVYQPATSAHNAPAATKPRTPTTTTPLPQAGDCEGWVGVAYGIGWPIATLDTLKLAMQLESGCDPAAVGDNGASIGLLQIHQPSWCRPNAYWPQGWMQHYGIGDCTDLYDPLVNLRVGLMLFEGWDGASPGWHHWHALP